MLEQYFTIGLVIGIILKTTPAMIIMVWITERIFKNKFKTAKAFQVISWILILNAATNLFLLLNGVTFNYPDDYSYWVITVCAIVLPLTLFFKNLARNSRYLFLVAILISSGHYLECYTIIVSTIARDFGSIQIGSYLFNYLVLPILKSFFAGAILTAVLLLILEIFSKNERDESTKPLDADLD